MNNRYRALLGSFLLLAISYLVYFLRYPIWESHYIEPVFASLILSYAVVLVTALVLLKKDAGKSLRAFFRFCGFRWIFAGLLFAVFFQAVWFLTSLALGGTVTVSFEFLKGYSAYAFISLPLAFGLYCIFSVFGAFSEEVAYRGYVQTRISSVYGSFAGILLSALFFSLQHIHIFQLNWIEGFFSGQFIYVLSFGIFAGYFFIKCKQDIWAVFAFHGLMNIFNIALPIQATTPYIYADWLRTILSFAIMLATLHFLTRKR